MARSPASIRCFSAAHTKQCLPVSRRPSLRSGRRLDRCRIGTRIAGHSTHWNDHGSTNRSRIRWPFAATTSLLSCAVRAGEFTYVGTEDGPHVLRVGATGEIRQLEGFDEVAGRNTWYAGSALINGQVMGPPLGVRSMTAALNGTVLLANVHVGG